VLHSSLSACAFAQAITVSIKNFLCIVHQKNVSSQKLIIIDYETEVNKQEERSTICKIVHYFTEDYELQFLEYGLARYLNLSIDCEIEYKLTVNNHALIFFSQFNYSLFLSS